MLTSMPNLCKIEVDYKEHILRWLTKGGGEEGEGGDQK